MKMNDNNDHQIISNATNQRVSVLQIDMRDFTLSTYFYLLNGDNVSLRNDSIARQLLRKAISNYYRTFKLFKAVHRRPFILNPIFIYEIVRANVYVANINGLIDRFLSIMRLTRLTVFERTLVEHTYFSVLTSLEHGTLESVYSHWLTTLVYNTEEEHALLKPVQVIEKQMFSTVLTMSDEMREAKDEILEAVQSLPDKEERELIVDNFMDLKESVINNMPSREQWSKFSSAASTFRTEFPRMNNSIEHMQKSFAVMEDLKKQITSMHIASTKVIPQVQSFCTQAMDILACSATAWTLYNYHSTPSTANLLVAGGIGAASLYMTHSPEAKTFIVTSGLIGVFLKFSEKNDISEIEKQGISLDGVTETLSNFTSFITSIKWGTVPRRILEIIRLTKELPSFLHQVFELLKGFINSIWLTFYKTPLFRGEGIFDEQYDASLKSIYNLYQNDNLDHSFNESELVNSLIERTRLYMNSCKEFGDRKILESNLRVLLEVKKELADVRFSKGGSRQEPTVILLEGAPGTKKTIWSKFISTSVIKALKKDCIDPDAETYVKPSGDYWSHYKNQFVTCFDDFGQVRDSVGDPREKGDLINMYNTVPFPLNMNENEDKGKTFFTSLFVVMTANTSWDESPSIISKEALRRRIDIKVKIRSLQKDAVINDTGIQEITPSNYVFDIQFCNGTWKRNLDFQQLIDEACRIYYIKQTHYKLFKRVQDEIIGNIEMSPNSRSKLDKQLQEVEEHMRKLCGKTSDNVEKQSNAEIDLADLVMSHIQTRDSSYIDYTILLKAPKVKIKLPPLQEGEKIIDDFKFKCQYYEDMDDLEYMAARNLIIGYTEGDYDKVQFSEQEKKYLRLHYGEKRSEIFLMECSYLYFKCGHPRSFPLKQFVESISQWKRGYFLTELSLLMNIWISDRESFFKVFLDPAYSLKCMVQYNGFDEVTLLSDWKLAVRRNNKKIMNFCDKHWTALKDIIGKIENSIAEKIMSTFGFNAFNKQNVIDFFRVGSIIVVSASVAVPLLYQFVTYFLPGEKNEQSSKMFHKDSSPPKEKTTLRNLIRDFPRTKQSNNFIPIVQGIESSSAIITLVIGDVRNVLGKVFFLDKTHVLIPLHFYEDILNFKDAKYIINDGELEVKLDQEDLLAETSVMETEHLELVIFRSDKFKKARKNRLDNFASRDQISKLTSTFQVALFPYTEQVMVTGVAQIDKLRYEKYKTVDKTVKYNIDTGKGDCGSMVYVLNPSLGKAIICGMHEAGTKKGSYDKTGYAFIISKEDIMEALEGLSCGDDEIQTQGHLMVSSMHHSPYGNSKIVPSPIAGHPDIVPKKHPARLMPNWKLGIDPFENGIMKYKHYPMHFSDETLEMATSQVINELTSHEYHPYYGDAVSYDICFYGDPNVQYQKAIPTSTSCGFPYKFTDRYLKANMKEEGPDGPSFRKFLTLLEEQEQSMIKGKRLSFVHTANLKDETRSKDSTRVFFGTPLDLCLHTKRYFGEFVLFMQEDCVEKGTAMSVNPHSTDWKNIALRLSSFVPSYDQALCRDFDYAHFDGSNNQIVLGQVLKIINSWYNHHGLGRSNHVRELLFKEISNFKYIKGNDIIDMDHSLPSGSFLTLLVNCITNKLLMRYSFLKKFPELSFSNYVVDIVLGDDNVVSVHPEIAERFTPIDVAEGVSDLGFEITLGNKEQVSGSWVSLREISFLKRTFSISETKTIRAPLDLDTLWNTMCWSKRGILFEQILCDNIEFFYREASQHGKDVFERETGKLRKVLVAFPKFNVYPKDKASTWRSWDLKVRCNPYFANHDF